MLPEGTFLGSSVTDEIEWLQGSHKDQLRRWAGLPARAVLQRV